MKPCKSSVKMAGNKKQEKIQNQKGEVSFYIILYFLKLLFGLLLKGYISEIKRLKHEILYLRFSILRHCFSFLKHLYKYLLQ